MYHPEDLPYHLFPPTAAAAAAAEETADAAAETAGAPSAAPAVRLTLAVDSQPSTGTGALAAAAVGGAGATGGRVAKQQQGQQGQRQGQQQRQQPGFLKTQVELQVPIGCQQGGHQQRHGEELHRLLRSTRLTEHSRRLRMQRAAGRKRRQQAAGRKRRQRAGGLSLTLVWKLCGPPSGLPARLLPRWREVQQALPHTRIPGLAAVGAAQSRAHGIQRHWAGRGRGAAEVIAQRR